MATGEISGSHVDQYEDNFCGVLDRVVCQKFTDVSEVIPVLRHWCYRKQAPLKRR